MRLDADDYFSKDALKLMFREFDQKTLGMVFADWYLIDEKGEVLGVEQRHDFQKDVTLHDQPAHGACTMFRVSSLKKLGGYDESISRQDGYELWLRFIENYDVRNINVPLFYRAPAYTYHYLLCFCWPEPVCSTKGRCCFKRWWSIRTGTRWISQSARRAQHSH